VTFAWTATPPGCGTFANSGAASTEWTATAPALHVTQTAAAAGKRIGELSIVVRTHGRSYQYPLQVASWWAALIDQRGRPFLIKGETAGSRSPT